MKIIKILSILLLSTSALLSGCDKCTLTDESSTFLTVEEKNSSFIVKHTGTWCGPCGGWGFTQFQQHLDDYGSTEVLAACVSGGLNGANNDTIFDTYAETFDISATPTFHMNFLGADQGVNAALISAHSSAPVVANSNYELTFVNDKIKIKTTTEFFQSVSGTEYYLVPYIIVDSIVANQSGHPDGAITVHKKSLVDVASPVGFNPLHFGYKVAAGDIRAGYKVNLEFEADRMAAWSDSNISVGLVLSTKGVNGNPVFVNAFTKH